ncbi:hypothetical protein AX16_003820 [Volvariella volvacea WC 439]|nr:hypothetical protein AX16_003820 [Volvariella volvacea WC 439]
MQTTPMNPVLAELDAEIARLLELVRQLRARRNAISPINRLPRELLQEIMHHVKESAVMAERVSNDWNRIAQVCRHWREVALDRSTLWATIVTPPASARWMEELCKRSRSASLSLSVHTFVRDDGKEFSASRVSEIDSFLQDQMHRIQSLHLELASGSPIKLLQYLVAPAARLKYLDIEGYFGGRLTISDELLACHTPNLRYLRLARCAFNWDGHLLSETLRDLRIHSPQTLISADGINHLLASLPHLQNLELESAILPHFVEWGDFTLKQGHTQPPHLRALTIRGSTSTTTAYCVSQIHSACFRLFPLEDGYDEFLEKVASPILHSRLSGANQGFALSMTVGGSVHSPIVEELNVAFSTPSSELTWFETGTRSIDEMHIYTKQFCALIKRLPLKSLRELRIGHAMMVQQSAFRKFSLAPILDTLVLKGNAPGVVDFVWNLNEWIPQCKNHVQTTRNDMHFEKDWLSEDEEGEDEGESDDSSNNSSSDEESEQGSIYSSGGDEEDESKSSTDRETEEAELSSILDDIMHCEECQKLGKSFFPALRKLVMRGTDLTRWWITSESKRRINPITEFVIRRIRCGLPIEAITFEPVDECHDWDSSESHIQHCYQLLCEDRTPVIKVVRK